MILLGGRCCCCCWRARCVGASGTRMEVICRCCCCCYVGCGCCSFCLSNLYPRAHILEMRRAHIGRCGEHTHTQTTALCDMCNQLRHIRFKYLWHRDTQALPVQCRSWVTKICGVVCATGWHTHTHAYTCRWHDGGYKSHVTYTSRRS